MDAPFAGSIIPNARYADIYKDRTRLDHLRFDEMGLACSGNNDICLTQLRLDPLRHGMA